MQTKNETQTVRGEMLGEPVDFEIKTELDGDVCRLTVGCLMPIVEYDARCGFLRVFAPPLKEKAMSDRELRLNELVF